MKREIAGGRLVLIILGLLVGFLGYNCAKVVLRPSEAPARNYDYFVSYSFSSGGHTTGDGDMVARMDHPVRDYNDIADIKELVEKLVIEKGVSDPKIHITFWYLLGMEGQGK